MGIKALKIREDIKRGIDPAPKLGEVLSGKADKIYTDAKEFFKRTYFSENIIDLLKRVVKAIKGEESSRIFILYSFYGGGKTHSILTIYHAFKNPDVLKDEEVLKDYDEIIKQEIRKLADEIKKISKDLKIVIATGDDTRFFGHPTEPIEIPPYKIHTLWGYIAHNLGKYGLIENYDKNLSIPPQNKINDLLSGEKAIFIIDELIDYAHSMINSRNEYERGYVRSLPQFIEYFAKAIRATDSILIISLPVEWKEQKLETDWRYNKGFVQSIWNALKDFAIPISPLRTEGTRDDVVEVLKRRIFDEISEDIKISALQKLREKAVAYEEYFIGYEEFLKKFERTYPFHPDYLEVLEKLISHLKLQKTRDALKITIEVVKSIEGDPEYITVWHINPSLDSLRPMLFRDPFVDYEMVYRKDIEDLSGVENLELVKITLRTIFLSTYIYDSPVRLDDFPDKKKLVRMVYEPRKFTENNWEPVDVLSAIEIAYGSEKVTHLMKSEDKFWFWKYANVKELIEKRARSLLEQDDDRIYETIEEYLKLSERGRLSDGEGGRKRREYRREIVKFFDNIIYIKDFNDKRKVVDDRSLKLVVLVRKDLITDLKEEIFEKYGDAERKYKNTIVVLVPNPNDEYYDKIKMHAARLVACDLIEEEVSSFYAEHGESVVKAQKTLIEDFKNMYERDLIESILKGYTLIYYPMEVDSEFDVKEVSISSQSYHFPTAVYLTLSTAPTLKISDTLTFEALVRYIVDAMDVDITESDRIYTVGQIIDWFKQRSTFPMVKENVIKDALKEGVKLKKIGVLDENRIYFKKVYKKTPSSQETDEGVAPSILEEDAKVLPWRKAVEKQYEMLRENEKVEKRGDVVEKIWYEVIVDNNVLRLEELPNMVNWHYIFVKGFIVERREELKSDVSIEVYPGTRIVEDCGKDVRITIKAIPINLKVEKAEISVKYNGKELLSEEMKRKNGEFEFILHTNAPNEEGGKDNYVAVVKAYTPSETVEKSVAFTIEAKVKRKRVKLREIGEEYIGAKLMEIGDIKDYNILSYIETIPEFEEAKVSGNLIVKVNVGEIYVNYKGVEISVVANSAREIAEYGLESSGTFKVVPKEAFKLKDLTVRKLMELNRKVEFLLELED